VDFKMALQVLQGDYGIDVVLKLNGTYDFTGDDEGSLRWRLGTTTCCFGTAKKELD
jgi:hypothetical protein